MIDISTLRTEYKIMDDDLGQVVLVKDINPGDSSNIYSLIEFSGKLYFSANDGITGNELWVSDGTTEGTNLVKDIRPGIRNNSGYPFGSNLQKLTELNNKLYFTADDGENGRELWVSDGTTEGSNLAVDIRPGDNPYGSPYSSSARGLTKLNGKLYFTANDGITGSELWVSDGTTEGSSLVADIRPGNDGFSEPDQLIAIGDKLYFTADDRENGRELWVSDGTTEGTTLVADINPGSNRSGFPYSSFARYFIEFNGKLYFTANDGENGQELWVSDGTTEGTTLVADIRTVISNYGYSFGSFPRNFTEFNGKLYFNAGNDEVGRELWVTDGTTEGTTLVVDISPGGNSYYSGSYPENFTEFNGKLYFTANDGITGSELWVTDGTSEGTTLVADIRPSGNNYNGSSPENFTEFNGKLYFTANDGTTGEELWVTDGTAAGTQLVADINPGSDSSSPTSLFVFGNELFFRADNGETGEELFKLTFDDSVEPSEPNIIIGTGGANNLIGTDGADEIRGLDGQDTINGGAGDDTLFGNNKRDLLVGGAGNDRLFGGSGRDTLDGGLGNDTLTGNGNDLFIIREGDGSDVITDFKLGSDKLGLADGLEYDDLTLAGNTVRLGDEILVTLNNVNAENLRISDVEIL